MKYLSKGALLLLIIAAIPLSFNALSYINFDPDYGFLKLKTAAIQTGWYLPAYYAHVLVSGIILLLGIFQINKNWRKRWPKLHRLFGRMYVGGILCFAAPGGLIMSFFILRGPWVLSSFLVQCSLWFLFTYKAYQFIRNGDVKQHQKWILRSYSLTLAAITLRLYVFISSWSLDLTQPAAYAIIAWLSWTVNLLVCEMYFVSKGRKLQVN